MAARVPMAKPPAGRHMACMIEPAIPGARVTVVVGQPDCPPGVSRSAGHRQAFDQGWQHIDAERNTGPCADLSANHMGARRGVPQSPVVLSYAV